MSLKEEIDRWVNETDSHCQLTQTHPHIAYRAGALRMAKWWAERWGQLYVLGQDDGEEEKRILNELDATAKEVLK